MSEIRAGKVLSSANSQLLNSAVGHLDTATDRSVAAGDAHDRLAGALEKIGDAHAAATTAHAKLGEALSAAANNPGDTDLRLNLAAAQNAHRALGKHLANINSSAERGGMAQGDAAGALASSRRSIGAATRCVRGVVDSATYSDNHSTQTSSGIDPSGGSSDGRAVEDADYRRRQAKMFELAHPP